MSVLHRGRVGVLFAVESGPRHRSAGLNESGDIAETPARLAVQLWLTRQRRRSTMPVTCSPARAVATAERSRAMSVSTFA
jgi:hypothetical protein